MQLFSITKPSSDEQEQIVVKALEKASDTYYNDGEYYVVTEGKELEVLKTVSGLHNAETITKLEFTDALFDRLYSKAKKLWPNNPFFKKVGANTEVAYGEDVTFLHPMGSLNELKEGDLAKWVNLDKRYFVTCKLDGSSVKLIYKKGQFVQALSRGDGHKGKDITRHFKQKIGIKGVPSSIKTNEEYLEIRGELICPKADIPAMLDDLKILTGKTYKNGRNTMAGLLNSKEPSVALYKWANFVAYEIVGSSMWKSEQIVFLLTNNFLVPLYNVLVPGYCLKEEELIEKVKALKELGKYEYDGIVIEENQPIVRSFETNSINPKYARKFKLGAENNTAEATIQDIIWKVSKDGCYIPKARITPVDLVGATVQFVTLNNYNFMVSNKLGVGAKVIVRRSGDVIPQIIKNLVPSSDYRLPEEYNFDEPNKDGVIVHIKVKGTSEDAEFQKIVFFCKKLDVKQAGEANIKMLGVKSIKELILTLEEKFVLKIGRNGLKFYQSLGKSIETCPLPVFYGAVGALGRGIGQRVLEPIFEKFGDMVFDFDKLISCEGISEVTAEQIIHNKDTFLDWQKFAWANLVGFRAVKQEKPVSDKFKQYIVCFTGIRDENMERTISMNGGKIKSSVTSDTTLVVAKDANSMSGKAKKAREKGIKVISYEEALKLFAD